MDLRALDGSKIGHHRQSPILDGNARREQCSGNRHPGRIMNDSEQKNAEASTWMKRGIALLNENTRESLTESLPWFDRAIELRRSLPLRENSWFGYVLAAGWMNRGDALTRLGSPENLTDARRAYDEALTVLATLPLDANPLYRTRLTIAWLNRGITLQQQANFSEAVRSFDEAIAAGQTENDAIVAAAHANRGNALLALIPPRANEARESAQQAIRLLAGSEERDLIAAETGLKARHVLCRAIAHQLVENKTSELISTATDAVDDALKLARSWEARGVTQFRELMNELFRFGARAYQLHQPHFLMEFLLETLDPAHSTDAIPNDPVLHAAASEAIWSLFGEIQRDGFGATGFYRLLTVLRQLRITDARLAQLRASHLS